MSPEKPTVAAVFDAKFVPKADPKLEFLTPEQKIAQLEPGKGAATVLPNGRVMHVIGRVKWDLATDTRSPRQRKRAEGRGTRAE